MTIVTRSRRLALVAAAAVAALCVGGGLAIAAIGSGTPAPANDNLADAELIFPGAASFAGTLVGAGSEAGEPDEDTLHTVWFRWTAPANGTTLVIPTSELTPAIAVFTGAAFPLTAVDVTQADRAAGVSFTATEGTDYLFQVGVTGESDDLVGSFTFSLWQPTPGGPDNDAIANALSLDRSVNDADGTMPAIDGTTVNATLEDGEPGPGTRSVWYSWTVPNDGASLEVAVTGPVTLDAYAQGVPDGPGTSITSDVPFDQLPLTTPTPDPVPGLSVWDLLTHIDGSATTVTLTGDPGVTVYLRVSDTAGAAFTLSAQRAGFVPADVTAPTVSCDAAPADWNTGEVTIDCTASDAESGLADAADAAFTLTASTAADAATDAATTDTHTVCDAAGNCATAGPVTGIKIDNEAPALTCDPAPATWLTADAEVDCAASDDASGLADAADATFTLTAALAPGEDVSDAVPFASHPPVCDAVGNCADVPEPGTVAIDTTAPTWTCGQAGDGWHTQNVAIDCAVTDTGSGLVDATQSTVTLTTTVDSASASANAATASATVCDRAGNCAALPTITGIKVDRALPQVVCTPPGAWTAGTTVTVNCTATDQGSGLAPADQAFALVATIPAGTQQSGLVFADRTVCDVAGNCVDVVPPAGLGADDAPPIIVCESTPSVWVPGPLTVTCTADDSNGAGLADPAQASVTLSATVPDGTFSDHVTLTPVQICDAVGNCATTATPAPGKVDRVMPAVHCIGPAASATYAYNVSVVCTASDEGSGLADPATATFTLTTAVAPGTANAAALTTTRQVCDVAGNCLTAGGLGPYHIDRTVAPPGGAPSLALPGKVTALAAMPDAAATGVPVPFTPPTATSPLGAPVVGCVPDATGTFLVGVTTVQCSARDAADRVTDGSFRVTVVPAPELAPAGNLEIASPIPVKGTGFVGDVVMELDGTPIATLTPVGGAIDTVVAVPGGTVVGDHLVVLRGEDAAGDPRLVVMPITLVVHATGDDGGDTPGGDTPGGDTPGGSTPGGSTPGGTTPGTTPGGTTPVGPPPQVEPPNPTDILPPGPTDEWDQGGGAQQPPGDSAGGPAPTVTAHSVTWWWLAALAALLVAGAAAGLWIRRRA